MLVRRRREKALTLWCAACDAESFMLSMDEAAAFAGMSTMAIFRLAEAGRLHWQETHTRSPVVCHNSLLRYLRALPDSTGNEPEAD